MQKDMRIDLIQKSISRNPSTDIELCLYNPTQTLWALKNSKKLYQWHNYLLNEYRPKISEKLLFFPCAANKPWSEGITKSKNYQILYDVLNQNRLKSKISLHTISEPLGLIGEIDYDNMPLYDNPGLFYWFAKKNDLKWDNNAFQECLNILGIIIGEFLKKFEDRFKRVIAFVKPNSTHDLMLKIAKEYSNSKIIIGPKKDEIGKLENKHVWMANKSIQGLLLNYLTL